MTAGEAGRVFQAANVARAGACLQLLACSSSMAKNASPCSFCRRSSTRTIAGVQVGRRARFASQRSNRLAEATRAKHLERDSTSSAMDARPKRSPYLLPELSVEHVASAITSPAMFAVQHGSQFGSMPREAPRGRASETNPKCTRLGSGRLEWLLPRGAYWLWPIDLRWQRRRKFRCAAACTAGPEAEEVPHARRQQGRRGLWRRA